MRTTEAKEPLDSTPTFVISVVAVLAAVVGLLVLVGMTTGSSPAYGLQTEATRGDVSVWVENFQWLDSDHSGGEATGDDGGVDEPDPEQNAIDEATGQGEVFAMPAAMMPGQPDNGFQRIQVNISMINRATGTKAVDPEHFRLEVDDGTHWITLQGGTFVAATIGPNQGFSTVLAYDVGSESATRDMALVWSGEDGSEVRFALSGSGHSHG